MVVSCFFNVQPWGNDPKFDYIICFKSVVQPPTSLDKSKICWGAKYPIFLHSRQGALRRQRCPRPALQHDGFGSAGASWKVHPWKGQPWKVQPWEVQPKLPTKQPWWPGAGPKERPKEPLSKGCRGTGRGNMLHHCLREMWLSPMCGWVNAIRRRHIRIQAAFQPAQSGQLCLNASERALAERQFSS